MSVAAEKVLARLGLDRKPRFVDQEESHRLMRDLLRQCHQQVLAHQAMVWMNPDNRELQADLENKEEVLKRTLLTAKISHGQTFLSEREEAGDILTSDEQREFWKNFLNRVEGNLYTLGWRLQADPENTSLLVMVEKAADEMEKLQAALRETPYRKLVALAEEET